MAILVDMAFLIYPLFHFRKQHLEFLHDVSFNHVVFLLSRKSLFLHSHFEQVFRLHNFMLFLALIFSILIAINVASISWHLQCCLKMKLFQGPLMHAKSWPQCFSICSSFSVTFNWCYRNWQLLWSGRFIERWEILY